MNCPTCGRPLGQIEGVPWQPQPWKTLDAATGPAAMIPEGMTWERREPARPATAADVGVPLAYAAITALAVGGVATVLAVWRGWPLVIGGGVAVAVFAATWLALMGQWRAMLYRIETLGNVDIDRDGVTGEPEPHVIRLDIQTQSGNGGRRATFCDLAGISEAELLRLARLAVGDRLTERNAGLPRETWNRARDELIARGLLAWKVDGEPRQGIVATATGRAAFEKLLELS